MKLRSNLIDRDLGWAASLAGQLYYKKKMAGYMQVEYRDIFEGAQEAMLLVNLAEEIIAANQSAFNLLGFDWSELAAKQITDLLPMIPLNLSAQIDQQGPQKQLFVYQLTNQRGDLIPVELSITHLGDGEQGMFLFVMRDISERKRDEDANRATREFAIARTAELEILRYISEALDSTLDLKRALQAGMKNMIELLNLDSAWVYTLTSAGKLELAASCCLPEEDAFQDQEIPVCSACEDAEKLFTGEFAEPQNIFECSSDLFDPLIAGGGKGRICVPIRFGKQPMGIISLVSDPERLSSSSDTHLMTAISIQFGAAIWHAQVYADVLESIRREQRLNEIIQVISSSQDFDAMLQDVVHLVVDLVGASSGLISLLSADGENMVDMYRYNFPETYVLPADTLSPGVEVLNQGLSILIPDITTGQDSTGEAVYPDISSAYLNMLAGRGVQDVAGIIVVPVRAGEMQSGMLTLFSFEPGRPFGGRELALAEAVGRQAGVALQNVQRIMDLQRRVAETRTLHKACVTNDGESDQLARGKHIFDSLTNLYSQDFFLELARIKLERALRFNHSTSLIRLDVDHLEKINETLDFTAGDRILQGVAESCQGTLRKMDIVCRYSGEEFVILLPETSVANAESIAERLRQKIAGIELGTNHGRVSVTASFGISGSEGEGLVPMDELLTRAEEAARDAKGAGRNKIKIWGAGPDQTVR
ncbi:MAG: diguanylate cyclase [Anaerolineaceae bacterium]|nr:diguanylate cyclase [Anaerolineaceae bacterium]